MIIEKVEPLVTVVVVTYNSSKYVLETLDSVRSQSYRNIELVVTDDCSVDDTIILCRKWIDNNANRFSRATIIEANDNTGISGNCNRGLFAATGEWIKMIAGDDVLSDDCIEEYVGFANKRPNINCVSCKISVYSEADNCEMPFSVPDYFFDKSIRKQLRFLLAKNNFIPGSSVIMKTDFIKSFGGFDERFPMLDDYPLFVKVYDAGHKFYFLKKELIKYRVHSCNVSLSGNEKFEGSMEKYRNMVVPALLKKNKMYLYYWHILIGRRKRKYTNASGWQNKIRVILLSSLSPVSYYNLILRLFGVNYMKVI